MSCDHFDNAFAYIYEFSRRLGVEIRDNDAEVQGYAPHFDIATLARLAVTQRLMASAADLAKQADLLYSADIGQEEFVTRADDIFKELRT